MPKPKTKAVAILVRFPEEMKQWIEDTAERHYGSQNSVVLSCVKAKMDDERRKSSR
jgi:hypothetical protein